MRDQRKPTERRFRFYFEILNAIAASMAAGLLVNAVTAYKFDGDGISANLKFQEINWILLVTIFD